MLMNTGPKQAGMLQQNTQQQPPGTLALGGHPSPSGYD